MMQTNYSDYVKFMELVGNVKVSGSENFVSFSRRDLKSEEKIREKKKKKFFTVVTTHSSATSSAHDTHLDMSHAESSLKFSADFVVYEEILLLSHKRLQFIM